MQDDVNQPKEKYFQLNFTIPGNNNTFDIYVAVQEKGLSTGELTDIAVEAAVIKFREVHGTSKSYEHIHIRQLYGNAAVVAAKDVQLVWHGRET